MDPVRITHPHASSRQGLMVGEHPTVMLWPNGRYRVEINGIVYYWLLERFSEDLSTVIWKAPDGQHASKVANYEKTWRIKTT